MFDDTFESGEDFDERWEKNMGKIPGGTPDPDRPGTANFSPDVKAAVERATKKDSDDIDIDFNDLVDQAGSYSGNEDAIYDELVNRGYTEEDIQNYLSSIEDPDDDEYDDIEDDDYSDVFESDNNTDDEPSEHYEDDEDDWMYDELDDDLVEQDDDYNDEDWEDDEDYDEDDF